MHRLLLVLVTCLLSSGRSSESHPREGYFNGSSFVSVYSSQPLGLSRQIGLSFRSCRGGQLFSQPLRSGGVGSISLEVRAEGLILTVTTSVKRYESRLNLNLLDNDWHTVSILYRAGNLTISTAGHQQVIANSTYNSELLSLQGSVTPGSGVAGDGVGGATSAPGGLTAPPESALASPGAALAPLVVGKGFIGCILEGPSIVFNSSLIQPVNVEWGRCPLPNRACETVDHCEAEPCMRHGRCIRTPQRYICQCTPRYSGNNCQIDNGSPCERIPCKNNGKCIEDASGDFACHCAPGYTGRTCEVETRNYQLCENNFPCQNDATCRLTGGRTYYCQCKPGFEGKDCEININECLSVPCLHGGTCIDGINDFKCLCGNSGYTGPICEVNINECENNPCLNNGICFDTYGGYTCQCAAGFGGQNCELKLSECSSNPCNFPNSVCVESGLSYQCLCRNGFSGVPPNCSRTEPCSSSNPCANGGTCIPTGEGSSLCLCQPSYTGALCETNSSGEPSSSAPMTVTGGGSDACGGGGPCLNGGTCITTNSIGTGGTSGYICDCPAEFSGAHCEVASSATTFSGEPCSSPRQPCLNNGTCMPLSGGAGYYCECADTGFEGSHCESNINDCLDTDCPEGKVCVDEINSYRCEEPAAGATTGGLTTATGGVGSSKSSGGSSKKQKRCAPLNPCLNGGTCTEDRNKTCICPPGFEGDLCEKDINECDTPGLCVNGICRNTEGSYQCFCTPGFAGDHCEIDFDECLSHPCFNGATCINKVNGFDCLCMPGYTGKDCSVNINECEPQPCQNGARCIDEVATFTCICPGGLTGRLCETNIDDCASDPCQNDGICKDGLNSYSCDCSETGFTGVHCEVNIDECVGDPCVNGGTCVDLIKGYTCTCFPGYTGVNCEIDIDECSSSPCKNEATCLQKSQIYFSTQGNNSTSYGAYYDKVIDYSRAAGYECVCPPGIKGVNCEIDINECESSPCRHGSCTDLINGYSCVCEEGYEGLHCEIEIDECEKYKPCVHGLCTDRPANYVCDCEPGYGGKNCSVQLTGCTTNQCFNGGTCSPYLEAEVHQLFNCTCPHGYQGPVCEKITTMFYDGDSYGIVTTSREEGYDIRLRFKTTLPDGLLALGTGPTYYILELSNGRLNLHSSLLNKWEGVFIGSGLNDSNWQQIFVTINSTHLVLGANQEQTIYPITYLNEGANASHTSFGTTYIGGAMSYLRKLPHGPSTFRGCVEDVMINNQWVVLPVPANSTSISLKGVQLGCQREPQCSPNPCHSGGHCTDLWNNFSCSCERPYLGNTCQYNYTAATFGHENITDSVVTVTVDPAARRAVRTIMDISMFIRTREPQGGIFYLGSKPGSSAKSEETIIAARLSGGELQVSIQFNATPESYSVAGVRIDTGYNQLIQVIRNVTLIQIKINGTEFFRKTITVTGQLDLQILQLGSTRPFNDGESNFKGVIQDVQMSNGTRNFVVEFFPLVGDAGFTPPLALGQVEIDPTRVLRGIVSDDNCRSMPCSHQGICSVTWNDFNCDCPVGFKGKQCEEMEFCQMQDCPAGSECRNLNHGYECVTNITLHDTPLDAPGLRYRLVGGDSEESAAPSGEELHHLTDISISYRSRTGGNLLFIGPDAKGSYLSISVYRDQVYFDWNLGHGVGHEKLSKESPDGGWTTVWLQMSEGSLSGWLSGTSSDELTSNTAPHYLSANSSLDAWAYLLATSNISIGGCSESGSVERVRYSTAEQTNTLDTPLLHSSALPSVDPALAFYQGCLGEVRIGGLLLSYFTAEELNATTDSTAPESSRHHFELLSGSGLGQLSGCILCFQEECHNDGTCEKPSESYLCKCVQGFEGDDCSQNIDECRENDCKNNSTCIDGLAKYTCECRPGWEGPLCDNDIDECASNPCQHGGSCTDQLAHYLCLCPPEYVGTNCEQLKQVTCESRPCHNGASCTDLFNPRTSDNFTCTCQEGFEGAYCEHSFCELTPCHNSALCISTATTPYCECPAGFTGRLCETNIDECASAPCQHRSTCIDGIDGFSCDCAGTGFTGPLCTTDLDECLTGLADCGPAGECVNTQGSFTCRCSLGLCGQVCNMSDPCLTNPCEHGGTCLPKCEAAPDYVCICTSDFRGKNCTESGGAVFAVTNVADVALVVVPILGLLLICGVVALLFFIGMARKKRATRGTYSPSSQEFSNPRLELDNVMKPPPEERLI